jgi:hypothetical protein
MGEKSGHPFRGNQFTSSGGKHAANRGGKGAWLNQKIADHNAGVRKGGRVGSGAQIKEVKSLLKQHDAGLQKAYEGGKNISSATKAAGDKLWEKHGVSVSVEGGPGWRSTSGLTRSGKDLEPVLERADRMLKYKADMKKQSKMHKKTAQEIEAYGVKGGQSKDWRKSFKNRDAMNKWTEQQDAEVRATRPTEAAYASKVWRKQRADFLRQQRKSKRG